ncbi:hypothetical protein PoB_006919100 [Plakobranchus ocellatus]|uniref:Uncharacterized protein n=1 Tax=Plakobranchus ocellatus TaxID=259542 RepID=A0AAV4DEV8_9GAST|nr:hypothetical protein PoB_006919100 [Plakobranchus ocellatus]
MIIALASKVPSIPPSLSALVSEDRDRWRAPPNPLALTGLNLHNANNSPQAIARHLRFSIPCVRGYLPLLATSPLNSRPG